MALHRLAAAAVVLGALALAGAAPPTVLAEGRAKPPTRLWYTLDLRYSLTATSTSEGLGSRNETTRTVQLDFGASESVLLRNGDGGLGFRSSGLGKGRYIETLLTTSYGRPAECPPSTGIKHTRAFGTGAAIIGRNAISFRWVATRGDVTGNTAVSHLEPDPAGGPAQCKTLENAWTRALPFTRLEIPWLEIPASAGRAFGRRSVRFSVTRRSAGATATLTVFLNRCPGTAPCAGDPPEPQPGLPPPPP